MTRRRATALLATLLLMLVAAGCGGDGGGDGFSEEVRSSYMDGCMASGNEAFCDCTLEEFEATFSQDEFEEFAFGFSDPEEPPEEFMAVVAACIAEAGES